jgi:hypothetical protein
LSIIGLWSAGLVTAFGLLQWSAGLQPGNAQAGLASDFYISATTLVTLDSGQPRNAASRWLSAIEGVLGFGLLAISVGYLPLFYQSVSKREVQISLLDARAGSPPSAGELLQVEISEAATLSSRLEGWERWSAELLDQQLSFPMLAWYRSHHPNQSWLTALTAMVDAVAVIALCSEGDLNTQAELTFAMGRHVIADMATLFDLQPVADTRQRLSASDFSKLREALIGGAAPLRAESLREEALADRRAMYEPQAQALSEYFLMALPAWIAEDDAQENWRSSGKRRKTDTLAVSDPFRHNS